MAKKPSKHTAGHSTRAPHNSSGEMPSQKQVLEFIQTSDEIVGKREIARAFGLKGQEKIALKRMLKDMAEEGLIDGKRTAYRSMGGVPRVTVLRVVEIEDGEPFAIPDRWEADEGVPPPRLRIIESKGGKHRHAALKIGDCILARTEETQGSWRAFVMKKLPARAEGLMGVVEIDASGAAWLAPVDKKARHSLAINDLGSAQEGQLVRAESTGRSARGGVKITEVMGNPLAPKSISMIALSKLGIPNIFPDEVVEQADAVSGLTLNCDNREDLLHLPIIAIDPSDARDHDDAIWAEQVSDEHGEGFKAIVAIADVSFYVRPGTALDKEARKRGNSVYFPDSVVPMLPEVLSADSCSLRAGEPRAAMVCHLRISAEGRVTQFRFARGLVQIDRVISYQDAQKQIDEGSADNTLQNLWSCWAALAKARENREPLDLDLPERRVILDEQGKIAEVALRERLDAHRVVEDFMIAANVAAAKALEAKNAPVSYRNHEAPSREKLIALRDYMQSLGHNLALGQVVKPALFNGLLAKFEDENEKAQAMEAVLRSQSQAVYGPANCGHFGLALGSYAHFTSPIRRYSDLLIHRSLVDAYGLEQPDPQADKPSQIIDNLPKHTGLSDKDRADLGPICEAICITERRAMEAERDTVDRYVAAYLAGRVGEVFETRITGVQNFGFFATILGLGGDGLVPISTLGDDYFLYDQAAQALIGERGGQKYAAGDRLKLKLGEANPLTGALKFVPLDADGNPIEPRGGRDGRGRGGGRHGGGHGGRRGGRQAGGERGRSGGGERGRSGGGGRGRSGGERSGRPRGSASGPDGAAESEKSPQGKSRRSPYSTGARGRPANIRHDGKKRR